MQPCVASSSVPVHPLNPSCHFLRILYRLGVRRWLVIGRGSAEQVKKFVHNFLQRKQACTLAPIVRLVVSCFYYTEAILRAGGCAPVLYTARPCATLLRACRRKTRAGREPVHNAVAARNVRRIRPPGSRHVPRKSRAAQPPVHVPRRKWQTRQPARASRHTCHARSVQAAWT